MSRRSLSCCFRLALAVVPACAEPSGPSAVPATTVGSGAPSSSLAAVEPVPSAPVPLAPVELAPAPVRPELASELNHETLAALVRAADGDIQALLHPELGVWLIHNMAGSVPHLVLRDAWPKREHDWKLESQFVSASILESLADASSWPVPARPPDPDNCDHGSPRLVANPSEALDHVLDIHMGSRADWDTGGEQPAPWLLRTPAELRALDTRPLFAPARWARLQRLRAAASHHVVLEQDAVVEFGRIDGRWYLLGIDGRHDACG